MTELVLLWYEKLLARQLRLFPEFGIFIAENSPLTGANCLQRFGFGAIAFPNASILAPEVDDQRLACLLAEVGATIVD